jgi:hypothetical protein
VSPLWVFVVSTVVAGAALLVLAARRAHAEIRPTLDAFEGWHDALGPHVAALTAETERTRRRTARAARDVSARTR